MTVQTTTSRADYTGNGVTTLFTVPFYFVDQTHIQVLRTQISTGTVTTLALATDYTVAGVGGSTGGTITTTVAPTTDQKISILRNLPLTQLTHYVPNDPFPAASHEGALDMVTMEIQQVNEVVNRSLSLPANTSGVSTTLPSPVASKLIGWNTSATALQNIDPSVIATNIVYGGTSADVFSGTGAQTVFNLSQNPGSVNNLDVSISGVTQRPTLDYTWTTGTTLTFVTAPPAGTDNVLVRYNIGLSIGTVNDGSITPAKLSANGPTWSSSNYLLQMRAPATDTAGFQAYASNGFAALNMTLNGVSVAGTTLGLSNANLAVISSGLASNFIIQSNFAGIPVHIGTVGGLRLKIDDSGNVLAISSGGGLGYGTGAGGTVTQATSKTTAVTINAPCGLITMNNAALASGASVSFSVNNSVLSVNDNVVVTVKGASGYRAEPYITSVGVFAIRVTNVTAGSLSEAVQLNFAIIKGAVA